MRRRKRTIRIQSIVLTILLLFSTLVPPTTIFAEGNAVDGEEVQEQLSEQEEKEVNEVSSEESTATQNKNDEDVSADNSISDLDDKAMEKDSKIDSAEGVEENKESKKTDKDSNEESTSKEVTDEDELAEEVDERLQESEEEEEKEETREPTVIEENIITEGSLILEKSDGTPVSEEEVINLQEGLKLKFDWDLPNDHTYIEGDTFTLQLPEQFAELIIPEGSLNEFGTYSVDTNGLVTFTFSEEIEKQSNITGHFSIEVELDEQKITKTEDVLEFKVNDEVVEKIAVNYQPIGGQAIQKNGKHADDRKFNTEAIDWTVNLNTTLESLTNAQIKDAIMENQELELDSIELYEAEVNIKGEIISVKDEPIDISGMNESTKDQLLLNLGDTNKAYQLKFKTKITDDEGTSYTNTAVLTSDNKEDASSGATISVGRQEHLKKSSSKFNENNHSVDWQVQYNFDEKQLEKGNVLTDEFTFTVGKEDLSDKFEVTDIVIKQVESFHDNGSVKEATEVTDIFDINIDGNKVTYTLKEDTKKPFIIEYKTKLKEGEYITHNGEISNTVTVDGEMKNSKQGVHQQVGVKSHKPINYEDKTIEWTVEVNKDNQDLRNFILKDSFRDSGQKLVEDSIEITPAKESANISIDEDKEGFQIDFGNITETYTITYKTKFTYDFGKDKKPNFVNNLNLEYETSDGKDYTLEIIDKVRPNKNTTSNGAKNGEVDQETKEITWLVDINYNQLNLDDAKFEDPIAENQSLIADSVKVFKTSVNKKGSITQEDEVTDSYTVNTNNGEKISIDFGEIDQSYRIVFKTKDKDDIYNGNEKYENTAHFIPREGELHKLKAHVTLPNQGEFLGKSGEHNKGDWTIDWKIDINKSKSKLTDIVVTDDLGDEDLQILLKDSFELKKAGKTLEKGEDYKLDIEDNSFTLNIEGETTDHYVLTYSSYILAGETADLTNEAQIKSNEEVVGKTSKEESIEVKIGKADGEGKGETGDLVLQKIENGSNHPLEGVEFVLKTTVGNQEIVVREGTTDKEGKIHWLGLKYGTYTLLETVPEGYLAESPVEVVLDSANMPDDIKTMTIENERKKGTAKIVKVDRVTEEKLVNATFKLTNLDTNQTFTLKTNDQGIAEADVPFGNYSVEEIKAPEGYKVASDIDNIEIEIEKTTEIVVENDAIIQVAGKKTWFDNESERPESITLQLFADGKAELIDERKVTADDNWEYTFKELPKYDAKGNEINYTIKEVPVDGYITHIDGHDLVNIQKINITGQKTWKDGDSTSRPDMIKVDLLQNGKVIDTAEVTAETDWKYSFKDLPKTNLSGEEYKYTVKEQGIPGYKTVIDGFDITNTRSEKTSVEVTKGWLDGESKDRPKSITVNLLQNDEVLETVEITESDDWKYEFKNLEAYDENGVAYEYKVKEEPVEGYKTTVDGFDITNLRVGKTEVTGTKTWKDDNSEDRPKSITVELLQNGEVLKSKEVTAENDWKYSFTDLDKYDENGVAYKYTVQEQAVEGYKSTVDNYDITNVRVGKTDVSGTKMWKDDNPEDRPELIKINLLRNGVVEDTAEVTAKDNWEYSFTDLEKYDAEGKAYEYTVKEQAVPGYQSEVDGFDITNTRSEKTSIEVTKAWLDDDSEDRPESITVTLLQNGEEFDTVEITAENEWTYVFEDLEAYDKNGKAYEYTVEEKPVEGYETTIDGFDITNVRVGKTDVSGMKTWKDDNSKARPESITVELLQNGEKVDSKEVTSEDSWKYSFRNLDKYDENGVVYKYTVQEKAVKGYETTIDEYDITNLRVGKTEVSGIKTWKDDNSEDRPESITVELLQNDKVIDSTKVTFETDWTYSFTDLEKYDKDGVAYKYTVKEQPVKGYKTTIDGFDITNLRVGKTSVEGEKIWKDDNSKDRPKSITVELLQNGEKVDSQKVTAENDWKYSFTDLDKYDENGVAYKYTVQEQAVEGYKSTVDNYDITNVRVGKTDVSGTKMWKDDNPEDRPELIKVNLLRNGVVEDTAEVTAKDNWEYSFTDLEKYDAEGKAYEYTVKEQAVPGYQSEVDGFDITNTRSEKTSIEVTKGWLDDDSEDRPESITVTLLQNGEEFETVEITGENEWTYVFEDLEAYDKNGKAYEYTVEEKPVEGYETTIDGFDITNVRVGKTDVSGMKTWKDDNSKDRPESITVELLQNGEKIDTQEVTADSDWKYSFTELDKYDKNGVVYDYSVQEKTIEGYETTIDGYDITNLRVGKTSIDVSKVWEDNDAKDRPMSITVNLLQNGKVIKTVEITADMDWEYTFSNLDKYDENGVVYKYSVEEIEVKNYKSTVKETDTGYEITNTLIEEPVEPKPEEPSKPEDPEQPSKEPSEPEDPIQSDKDPKEPTQSEKETEKDGNKLPSTATNIFNLFLIGAGMLVVGIALLIYRRKTS